MKSFADPEEGEGEGCRDTDGGSWRECVDVDVKDKGEDVMGPSEEEFRGCQR